MLGSEYNWLISHSRPAHGTPQVRVARGGLLTLAVAVFCVFCVALHAEPAHRVLLREASAAAKANDIPLYIAKLEAARTLRPDYPRVLYNLARGYTAAGRADDAIAQLRELAAMGLAFDIAKDEALAPLRDRPDFIALTQTFAHGLTSTGKDEAAWAITGMDGIIEGLAVHPDTLESFFSDVHNRCIWYRDVSGPSAVMKKFSADSDGLLGVFALKIDPARHTLWASSSALPEMIGYTDADKGRAMLAAYDLDTRKLRQAYPLPGDGREHVLGDFVLAADGSIFVSDSTAPVIWRLAANGTKLQKWLEHGDFVSLQGLAFSPDGRSLIVADYANGLWRIDLATHAATLLPAPAHATLFGIDGLYAVPGGLVAVQNGINPPRVIRIAIDAAGQPTGVTVLLSGHTSMSDISLGQVINGHFDFVGNSGWALYSDPKAAPAARNVIILRTALN